MLAVFSHLGCHTRNPLSTISLPLRLTTCRAERFIMTVMGKAPNARSVKPDRAVRLYIAEWRAIKRVQMTGQQLAEALGVDKGTVSRWETGARPVDSDAVAAIAEVFGIKPSDLWRPPTDAEFNDVREFGSDELEKFLETATRQEKDALLGMARSLIGLRRR